MSTHTVTRFKAVAVPSRILLHPAELPRLGGNQLRQGTDSATSMRRTTTSGQTWRSAGDVAQVIDPAELRIDELIATEPTLSSVLAMREDGVMLLSGMDEATAGLLCHLAKTLKTTFMVAPIPAGADTSVALLRKTREELIGGMKKGAFRDSYHWTNVAHVNEAADVVKRFKIKTGEIKPDADKKADAKEKKKAAVQAKAQESAAGAAE